MPDAVLAGAGAAHARSRACDTRCASAVRAARAPPASFGSNSTSRWKLPSPTWPTIGADQPSRSSVGARLEQAVGEARDRHARVGRERPPRPAAARAPRNTRCDAPSTAASGPPAAVAHWNALPPCSAAMASISSACSRTPARGAVELEEQRRLRVVALELRVADARLHLHLVEELDARDRNAVLHRDDHGVAPRRAGPANWQTAAEIASGHAVEPQLDLGDDAERAFGCPTNSRVRS